MGICVQFDSLRDNQAFRWVVPPAGTWPHGRRPSGIGSVNTGEPGSLRDFMAWAGQTASGPALRGHYLGAWQRLERRADLQPLPPASGGTRDASPAKQEHAQTGDLCEHCGAAARHPGSKTRALCYDDSARDFLDNQELRRWRWREGADALGRPRVDVLGLDACLMTMLEVAYEIRREAGFLVGSETVLPQEFWPWRQLLGSCRRSRALAARDVARLMGGHLPGEHGQHPRLRRRMPVGARAGPGGGRDRMRSTDGAGRASRCSTVTRAQARFESCLAEGGASGTAIPRGPQTDYVDLYDLLRVLIESWDLTDVETFLGAGEDTRRPPRARSAGRRTSCSPQSRRRRTAAS